MPETKKKTPKKKPTGKPHVKPTQEELEADIKKRTKELEALRDAPSPSPSPEPPKEPVEPSPSPSKPSEPPEPTPSPSPSPEVPSPSPPAPSKEVIKDMHKQERKKRIASAQEAQVLHARNKKINEGLEKIRGTPEPTEDEMKAEYPDWEVMSDFEKKQAKGLMLANRRFAAIDEMAEGFKDSEKHQKKVDDFLADPKTLINYPELEGKGDEFKFFATKPTRRGVDFEDLVPAFLYGVKKTKQKTKKKGEMFPTGTGGPAAPDKDAGKISVEEAIELRKTDSKKYKKLLLAGKISTEI